MDSNVTVEEALVQGIHALQMIGMSVPGSDIAGIAFSAALLTGQVLDIIIEAADGSEEENN